MRHLRALTGFLLVALALLGLSWRWWQAHRPLYTTGEHIPDAVTAGTPDFALSRAADIWKAWKHGGESVQAVPFALRFLPDQKYSETGFDADGKTPIWGFPDIREPPDDEMKDVLAVCDLYARQNTTYLPGNRLINRPSGFWIVVWKSGKIEKVPVTRLRILPTKFLPAGDQGQGPPGSLGLIVFPGLPGYERGIPVPQYQAGYHDLNG